MDQQSLSISCHIPIIGFQAWRGTQLGNFALEGGCNHEATNFDRYLKEQLTDPAFARRFKRAGQAWDVALQIAALRQQAGLSQKELAHRVKTSQQQICRLESPAIRAKL